MHRFKNIPQDAWFFWGLSPMPWLYAMSIQSFKQKNPDWTVTLVQPNSPGAEPSWETNEQKVPYGGIDYLPSIEGFIDKRLSCAFPEGLHDVIMADIARHELMYFKGGVWVDMDVLTFKPMNALPVPDMIDILVCQAVEAKCKYFSTGVVMASPKTKYYYVLIDAIQEGLKKNTYQMVGPDMVREKFKDIEAIKTIEPEKVIGNIDLREYYAISYNHLQKLYIENHPEIIDPCMGVHWYGGADLSMKVRNHMTPETVHEYRGTTIHHALTKAGVL